MCAFLAFIGHFFLSIRLSLNKYIHEFFSLTMIRYCPDLIRSAFKENSSLNLIFTVVNFNNSCGNASNFKIRIPKCFNIVSYFLINFQNYKLCSSFNIQLEKLLSNHATVIAQSVNLFNAFLKIHKIFKTPIFHF